MAAKFTMKVLCLILIIEMSLALVPESSSATIKSSPVTLGNLYRTAEKGYRSERDSRCIKCGYGERNAEMRYTPSYNDYDRGAYMGRGNAYDDKNWYYQPDRYMDDRHRYGYDSSMYTGGAAAASGGNRYMYYNPYFDRYYDDQYYNNRYDDRYSSRPTMGAYDRYDPRTTGYDYRGNGYDNRDPHYYENRDRGYGGAANNYYERDRDYYRYPMNSYDNKNFRPWDETYRGTSGFDNSGRGYYFANRPTPPLPQRPHSTQPSSPQHPSSPPSASLQNYNSHHNHPPSASNYDYNSPNGPSSSSSQSSASSSSSQSSPNGYHSSHHESHYDGGSGSSPNSGLSGGDGPNHNSHRPPAEHSNGYAGAWSYVNDRDKLHDYNRDKDRNTMHDYNRDKDRNSMHDYHRDRDTDKESTAYGTRPRPLGTTSYLHERDTNTPAVSDELVQVTDDSVNEDNSGSSSSSSDNNKSNNMDQQTLKDDDKNKN